MHDQWKQLRLQEGAGREGLLKNRLKGGSKA